MQFKNKNDPIDRIIRELHLAVKSSALAKNKTMGRTVKAKPINVPIITATSGTLLILSFSSKTIFCMLDSLVQPSKRVTISKAQNANKAQTATMPKDLPSVAFLTIYNIDNIPKVNTPKRIIVAINR